MLLHHQLDLIIKHFWFLVQLMYLWDPAATNLLRVTNIEVTHHYDLDLLPLWLSVVLLRFELAPWRSLPTLCHYFIVIYFQNVACFGVVSRLL